MHAFAKTLGLIAAMAVFPDGSGQAEEASAGFEPIRIEHALGETVLDHLPARVAVLDMNELDFLDQLGVPVAGTPKDFVPHFLAEYAKDPKIQDLGFIVSPNIEKVYALRPDLVLMTSLQAEHYQEISSFAPVLYYDVDYRDGAEGHLQTIRSHFMTLAQIFGKEDVATVRIAELDDRIASLRELVRDRQEKALIIMHNNGAFSSFGVNSRYGFVFSDFGVKPASEMAEASMHGQPVTSEFIQAANPDIIFIIDRTAVMEHRPVLTREAISNPLLKKTNAWMNDKVIFVDPEAWYVTAAGPTSISRMIDDIAKGYVAGAEAYGGSEPSTESRP